MYEKGRKTGTVKFTMIPKISAKSVFLAGQFSDWKPLPMRKRDDGKYSALIPLPAGRTYEYKFIIDGQWVHDPDNPLRSPNPLGSVNSIAAL